MALNFDTSQRPQRSSDQASLLAAILAASAEDETEWLEWKSTLDLSTAEGQFKLAKEILGLANRSPSDARHFVDGYGYVAVGIEPSQTHGMAKIDPVDIDNKLAKYLGTGEGPSYFSFSHAVEGRGVLLVEVAPPCAGDRIHTLRKTFAGQTKGAAFTEGTVFVRRGTGTFPASAAEIRALEERLISGSVGPEAVISIQTEKGVFRLIDHESYAAHFVEAERVRLLAAIPTPSPPPKKEPSSNFELFGGALAAQLDQFSVGVFAPYSESRSETEYRDEVAEYLVALEDQDFRAEVEHLLHDSDITAPVFVLRNESEVNLEEVDIDINIEGEIFGFEPISNPDIQLPAPPRLFGDAPAGHPSRQFESFAPPYVPDFRLSDLTSSDHGPRPIKPPFTNSGSVSLNYFEPHLRPMSSERLQRGKVLSAESDSRDEVVATWTATARNVDRQFSGTIVIPVKVLPAERLHPDSSV